MEDFEYARDRILMGIERKYLKRGDKQLMDTAVHEAGHVLAIYHILGEKEIYKSTIVPHSDSLGGVQSFLKLRPTAYLKNQNSFHRVKKL